MFDKKLFQKYDEQLKKLIHENIKLMVERDRLLERVRKLEDDKRRT